MSQNKTIHVVNFDYQNSVDVGRTNDAEVRIQDISVSRYHSTMWLEMGKLKITDHKSKFGTLKLI